MKKIMVNNKPTSTRNNEHSRRNRGFIFIADVITEI